MFRFNYQLRLCFQFQLRYFNKPATYSPKFVQKSLPTTNFSKLKNDLKVVSENWGCETCSVGLWLDVGSRCENDDNNGVAHFLEHMYFKGTSNRNHNKLQMEALKKGITLKSYMTREMIAIQANCHKDDVEFAVSLLGEIVNTPKYDDLIMENEKHVILNEMQQIEQNYKEVVFDYLHATAYQGTPLSKSILGTKENVQNMRSDTLTKFVNNFFKAPKMVLAAVGDIDHLHLNSIAEKYLGSVSCNYENGIDQRLPCRFTASELRDRDDALSLGHVAIAFQGPSYGHSDNIPLLIASAINGSYDKTYGGTIFSASKLAASSFVTKDIHSYEHFFIPYHDTSLWGFYFTSTGEEMQLISEYIMLQFVRACTNISESEVNRAKNQLKTCLLTSLNGSEEVCDEIASHIIRYGRRIPTQEMIARIDMVNVEEVRETCLKYVYDKSPAIAAYGAIEGLPDINIMSSKTWWLRY